MIEIKHKHLISHQNNNNSNNTILQQQHSCEMTNGSEK